MSKDNGPSTSLPALIDACQRYCQLNSTLASRDHAHAPAPTTTTGAVLLAEAAALCAHIKQYSSKAIVAAPILYSVSASGNTSYFIDSPETHQYSEQAQSQIAAQLLVARVHSSVEVFFQLAVLATKY